MANTRLPAQLQAFTLAGSGASPTDTTVLLSSFTDIDGNPVSMAELGTKAYGTIEPASGTQEEQISFTGITQNGNGTATLLGVSNVGFLSPYTETSGLSKSHAGGVTFVISNTSAFYSDFANTRDTETISEVWTFDETPTITNDPVGNLDAVNKEYVDGLVVAGAPNGNTTTKGIYQSATVAQQGTHTAVGSTGASLIPVNGNLISASAGAADASKIVVLNAEGAYDESVFAQFGTSGVAINAGQAVRIGGDGNIYLTDPTDVTLSTSFNSYIGVSLDTVGMGQPVRYLGTGRIVGGLPSFGANDSAPVYLGNTAGSLSLTPGIQPIVIGWVMTATSMLILSPTISTQFFGNASDGSLVATSGTTTLNTSGKNIYQYSGVSLTSTAALAIGSNLQNTPVVVFCQGNLTLTSSATPTVNGTGLGGQGGAAGTGTTAGGAPATNGSAGTSGATALLANFGGGGLINGTDNRPGNGGGGGGGYGNAGVAGTGAAGGTPGAAGASWSLFSTKFPISRSVDNSFIGGGGGGGSGGRSAGVQEGNGGAGGVGGACIIFLVGGNINITSALQSNGSNGANGGAGTDYGGGAGGGGAGGFIGIYYAGSVTANTSVITTNGGSGGSGGSGGTTAGGAGGAGGAGQSDVRKITSVPRLL